MRQSTCKEAIIAQFNQHHLVRLSDLQAALPQSDFSTIYRNVEQLVEAGVVRKVVIDSKTTTYELADHQHDHFVCGECSLVEAVDLPKPILGDREVHDIVVRGRCRDCIADDESMS